MNRKKDKSKMKKPTQQELKSSKILIIAIIGGIVGAIIGVFFVLKFGVHQPKGQQYYAMDSAKRIKKIKESTVRILVDGKPFGTGFMFDENGSTITNMHVLSWARRVTNNNLNKIEVELYNGLKKDVFINEKFQNPTGQLFGERFDVVVLDQKDEKETYPFLKLGDYSDVNEGDKIYTCGFPLSIDKWIFTSGNLSSKFRKYGQDRKSFIDLAWLDMTTNSGNSGGAAVVMKENPNEDVVVGIVSSSLSHTNDGHRDYLKEMIQNLKENNKDTTLISIISATLESSSTGIGGMISINHIKDFINQKK